ncbi:Nramp family divalent metal transporter [Cetobacterium somerae]|uniref:Nramp family divalent metal transporter n=1 Tax=Cetobacterium somerae TaxID=188913 RepID=UPI0022571F71|nr:Nramp family divalent metal transporter [Cetobacterium somerae]MCX3067160.1 Nramp family divalent metal transporter [Cetobacterium somerae]
MKRKFNILRYIGPGLLVTVGFIDPGNWAANISGGSIFGYDLLWVITLGTITLIILQHNVAHLGIVTGDCLAESIKKNFNPSVSKVVLWSAILANISVSLAEILGVAIALQMLFKIPIWLGSCIGVVISNIMIFTNTYKKLEKFIIGFVSIIGFSFIFELNMVDVNWEKVLIASVVPNLNPSSILVALGVFGAIVMPHNLFLHSEIIQSREWDLSNEKVIKRQFRYEFFDTFFSMILGWVINLSMFVLSIACFYYKKIEVTNLSQAHELLIPLLGNKAALIFALGLFFSGFSSSITAGMAGGTIYSGIFEKNYDIKQKETIIGVLITSLGALCVIFLVKDVLKALVYSQAVLCFQLPLTIASQLYLTSNEKIMGRFKNTTFINTLILIIGLIITGLNLYLFIK